VTRCSSSSSTATRSARSSGSCPPVCSTSRESSHGWARPASCHEEADLSAGRWHVLIDYYGSPGGLSEALRIFLARDLVDVHHGERFTREGEEHGMPVGWVDLDEAHEAVLAGRLHNPSAVVGILTAHAARARDWTTLRPHDAPWPEHPAYR
jgi:ADP-ribose pyrophosphatase